MKDLFSLNDDGDSASTETSSIFSQLSEDVTVVGIQQGAEKNKHNHTEPTALIDNAAGDKGKRSRVGSSSEKGKEKAENGDGEGDEETNILKSLFDAQGIHVSSLFL